MIDQQITCDVCGAPKRETNHWLVAGLIKPNQDDPNLHALAFAPFDLAQPEDGDDAEVKHICGQACAHKLLSQWLESLSSPSPERQES